MEGVIVLSGPIGVGKSSFANALVERFSAIKVGTRDYILRQTGCDNERRALQNAGDDLDRETDGAGWPIPFKRPRTPPARTPLTVQIGPNRATGPRAEISLSWLDLRYSVASATSARRQHRCPITT